MADDVLQEIFSGGLGDALRNEAEWTPDMLAGLAQVSKAGAAVALSLMDRVPELAALVDRLSAMDRLAVAEALVAYVRYAHTMESRCTGKITLIGFHVRALVLTHGLFTGPKMWHNALEYALKLQRAVTMAAVNAAFSYVVDLNRAAGSVHLGPGVDVTLQPDAYDDDPDALVLEHVAYAMGRNWMSLRGMPRPAVEDESYIRCNWFTNRVLPRPGSAIYACEIQELPDGYTNIRLSYHRAHLMTLVLNRDNTVFIIDIDPDVLLVKNAELMLDPTGFVDDEAWQLPPAVRSARAFLTDGRTLTPLDIAVIKTAGSGALGTLPADAPGDMVAQLRAELTGTRWRAPHLQCAGCRVERGVAWVHAPTAAGYCVACASALPAGKK